MRVWNVYTEKLCKQVYCPKREYLSVNCIAIFLSISPLISAASYNRILHKLFGYSEKYTVIKVLSLSPNTVLLMSVSWISSVVEKKTVYRHLTTVLRSPISYQQWQIVPKNYHYIAEKAAKSTLRSAHDIISRIYSNIFDTRLADSFCIPNDITT